MPAQRFGFHVLAKPVGAVCNLDCTYCFYLSKDSLYPDRSLRMGSDTLEAYIGQLLESQPDGPVTIAWQGGEPTLIGIDFFAEAVSLAGRLARPGQVIEHTIQTNGTLIDDEWARFLFDNGFLVGLSIDGPAPMHDAFRVWKNGRGSHADAVRAWRVLNDHAVETNILCSLHAANVDDPLAVYRYLRDELGAKYLQFIPIVERTTVEHVETAETGWKNASSQRRVFYRQDGDLVTSRSVSGRAYGEFLSTIFDEWVQRDVGTIFVQMFDVTLGAHLNQYSLCIHAPTCGRALAMEHNGDVYACDHYVEPAYLLGNIHDTPMSDVAASPVQIAFGRAKQESLPRKCRECSVLFACHGGCPKDRFAPSPEGHHDLNHLCDGLFAFFTHTQPAMSEMAELLRSGRDAHEIMAMFET